jgi:integrase
LVDQGKSIILREEFKELVGLDQRKARAMPGVERATSKTPYPQFVASLSHLFTDIQHGLMLRLLFYTGVRVAELCGIQVADFDLEACKTLISRGKGSKDRYVLFGKSFATALRTHIANHPSNPSFGNDRISSEVICCKVIMK